MTNCFAAGEVTAFTAELEMCIIIIIITMLLNVESLTLLANGNSSISQAHITSGDNISHSIILIASLIKVSLITDPRDRTGDGVPSPRRSGLQPAKLRLKQDCPLATSENPKITGHDNRK